eukprot:TRINITY_DN3800_c0_g5_i1.p1 TRINITY_DN3800_c0_g5~~TRINITY_DN3800_c0_g5_i1.p1  ORF type:complete len:605 (+),score=129.25 TRINITY_DN3800_c0_g5_i1:97-1911(+)
MDFIHHSTPSSIRRFGSRRYERSPSTSSGRTSVQSVPSEDQSIPSVEHKWTQEERLKNHDGSNRSFGIIKFVGKNPKPAQFITSLWTEAKTELSIEVDRVAQLMQKDWKLPAHHLIISVTGGAQTFNLPRRLERLFTGGLIKAAQNTSAWIITGGTDSGVMEFVGKAVKMSNASIPTVGIAAFAKIMGREEILKRSKKVVHYRKTRENSSKETAIEPNHNYFIFVDRKDGEWGDEIKFRTALENRLSIQSFVPIVLIVVQGGRGTLNTIEESTNRGFPIILIEGSDGAADAVSHYWDWYLRLKNPKPPLTDEDFTDLPETFFGIKKVDFVPFLKTFLPLAFQQQNITIYNPVESSEHFDSVLLRAILQRPQSAQGSVSLQNKLRLAVEWRRLDLFQELLDYDLGFIRGDGTGSSSSSSGGLNAEQIGQSLNEALAVALKRNLPEFIPLLMRYGARVSSIRVSKLYKHPQNLVEKILLPLTTVPELKPLFGHSAQRRRQDSEEVDNDPTPSHFLGSASEASLALIPSPSKEEVLIGLSPTLQDQEDEEREQELFSVIAREIAKIPGFPEVVSVYYSSYNESGLDRQKKISRCFDLERFVWSGGFV